MLLHDSFAIIGAEEAKIGVVGKVLRDDLEDGSDGADEDVWGVVLQWV